MLDRKSVTAATPPSTTPSATRSWAGSHKQGKLECETCHGPGSAHVKAGGGRGVGGIISFRTDDNSPDGGREQRHLSRLPRQGREDLLARQRARRARPRVHQLPHHHEGGVAQVPAQDRIGSRRPASSAIRIGVCRCSKSSHMPIREGKIVCSDCHSSARQRDRAAAEKSFGQRGLLHLPCGKARPVPVRA